MSHTEISTQLIPLMHPKAFLTALAQIVPGFTGFNDGERPFNVLATLDGRLVGRRRVWKVDSLEAAIAAIRQDIDLLAVDDVERRWLANGEAPVVPQDGGYPVLTTRRRRRRGDT